MGDFKTVYIYSSGSTFPAWIVGLGFMILSFIICRAYYKIHGTLWNRRSVLGMFMLTFATFWTFAVFTIQYSSGSKANKALKDQTYKLVEGEITDFDPMPSGGHKHESFKVNNVPFEYSDFEIVDGFHNAKSRGGPINGNGDTVRIRYYSNGGRNFILKLEIKTHADSRNRN